MGEYQDNEVSPMTILPSPKYLKKNTNICRAQGTCGCPKRRPTLPPTALSGVVHIAKGRTLNAISTVGSCVKKTLL